MDKNAIIITLAVAFVVVGGMLTLSRLEKPAEYPVEVLESLASCLTDSGAKMYGAYWCTHCQAQKSEFGEAVDLMPYVECAIQGSDEQTEECKNAGITSYPTWEFGDGGLIMGRVPLTRLAQRAGCEFPGVDLSESTGETNSVESAEVTLEPTATSSEAEVNGVKTDTSTTVEEVL